jgi:hypothetical protein
MLSATSAALCMRSISVAASGIDHQARDTRAVDQAATPAPSTTRHATPAPSS